LENTKRIIVFVYGTLKIKGAFSPCFDKFRLKVEKARVKGELYDLGGFPALILRNNDSYVYGEIHEYSEPNVVISRMDIIEGYSESNGHESTNLKKTTTVKAEGENRTIFHATAYVLAHRTLIKMVKENRFPKIESGEW
jgi:gamma-glutamylcyclotransferase (GGCT)/AIG2-like uncharacterized protein YtfP